MSIGYNLKNAILDHFFMIALLIFVLTDKKEKMTNMLIIKHHGLYYLIVKIKIKACNAGPVLIKYCKYSAGLEYICNTLSGGAGTYGNNTRPEADFSLSGKQVLDDPTTGRANELLHPFGSAVPGQNRVTSAVFPTMGNGTPWLRFPVSAARVCGFTGISDFSRHGPLTHTLVKSDREKVIRDDSRSSGSAASMPLPCCSGS
ncbi:hypothetical protein, partial [Desulfotignum phosphitoxidans]|uniref:hypothetical protein n=1 Tax=Desulfotignum phosphitoxidans TaxID=190898 RepID=UPI00191C5573